eukprot:Amastigsp_a514574_17.p3 type:complete len:145 gc:universal Amastigsp_a514574_17:561-127(-)
MSTLSRTACSLATMSRTRRRSATSSARTRATRTCASRPARGACAGRSSSKQTWATSQSRPDKQCSATPTTCTSTKRTRRRAASAACTTSIRSSTPAIRTPSGTCRSGPRARLTARSRPRRASSRCSSRPALGVRTASSSTPRHS